MQPSDYLRPTTRAIVGRFLMNLAPRIILQNLRMGLWGVLCTCLHAVAAGQGVPATDLSHESMATMRVYFGTYTGPTCQGIYVADFDGATGQLQTPRLAVETSQPSFLAIHPTGKYLYAVNELDEFQGEKSGALSAFAIEPDGTLRLLNQVSTKGQAPCHLTLDRRGSFVLVANYNGGNLIAFRIQPDGSLGPSTGFAQHTGASVDPQRQTAPHAHGVYFDVRERFVFVADLGLDKVLVYGWDGEQGTLTPHSPPAATIHPGAGPRHLAFRPDGKFAYVLNELDSTVTALAYDQEMGTCNSIQTISTLPDRFAQSSYTSEVFTDPTGRFLYCSNRGHDSIALFSIDNQSGQLTLVQIDPTQGAIPRGFGIDPTGRFLLVGNQQTNNVAVKTIDRNTGMLSDLMQMAVPTPVCIVFWIDRS